MEDFKLTRIVEFNDCPFRAIMNDKNEWEIVLGYHKVSFEKFKTQKEAKDYIDTKPWELILIGAASYADLLKENEKETKNSITNIE